ncbi:hypothetical protein, partial [Methylosinus sp. R-45379]|uniref:hypothetical protein n=1 Tax=Methylosinus sp. R-45379 TaxID=980563 RepID=UPI000B1BE09F
MTWPVENPSNSIPAFVAMRGAIGLGADLRELEVPSSPDQRHNIGVVGLEPSMFYANSAFHVLFNYSNNLGYVTCSGDPTIADNWSDPQIILGQGTGGWANQCLHGYALIDGSTIYFYFVSNSDWATYVTSTSLSTPTSGWSAPSKVVDNLGVVNGNIAAIKDPQSGVYYLLQEAQIDMAGCFGRSWQCVMLSASAATGPFSVVVSPIASLMPNFVAGSASAGWIGYDTASQTYLHYFHGASCSRSYPTNVYRARNTKGLQYDAWKIDNDGWPIATCVDIREVNQIADIFLCQGQDGQWYGIWEGVDNTNGGYANYLIVAKMDSPPKLMTTSGMAAAEPRHVNRPGFEHTRPFLI